MQINLTRQEVFRRDAHDLTSPSAPLRAATARLRHPASAALRLRLAGRGSNSDSLFPPPLAAVVVVAPRGESLQLLQRKANYYEHDEHRRHPRDHRDVHAGQSGRAHRHHGASACWTASTRTPESLRKKFITRSPPAPPGSFRLWSTSAPSTASPIINKRISVTPHRHAAGRLPGRRPGGLCQDADAAGKKVGVNFVGG